MLILFHHLNGNDGNTKMQINRNIENPRLGTHMAPLLTAVMRTEGPILELCPTDFSTPLLHAICGERDIYTLVKDREDLRLDDLQSPNHHFVTVVPDLKWGVVLTTGSASVDADIIVVHDPDENLKQYKYHSLYKRYNPLTVLVSDTIDVASFFQTNGINHTSFSKNKDSLAGHHPHTELDPKNINSLQYIDDNGVTFPWYTKPFLDELKTWNLTNKKVFEYGAGYSTIWWSTYAEHVTSVDDHYPWICAINDYLDKRDILNVKLCYRVNDDPTSTMGEGGDLSPFVNCIHETERHLRHNRHRREFSQKYLHSRGHEAHKHVRGGYHPGQCGPSYYRFKFGGNFQGHGAVRTF